MRFLKVITNSSIGGLLFGILLTLLIFDLNLHLNIGLDLFFRLSLFNFLTYGLVIIIISIIIFYIYDFFSAREVKISFFSPDYLIISFSLYSLLFAQIFWSNFKYYYHFFSKSFSDTIKIQLVVILFLGISGLIFYLFYYYYRKKIILLIYFILFILIFPSPFLLRIKYNPPIPKKEVSSLNPIKLTKKVNIICLEGLSLEFLVPFASEGKLPNFNWIMENGSWGILKSFTPCQPIIYYNSFLTGKYPYKHSVFSNYLYNFYNIKTPFLVLPRYIFMHQLKRINLLKISIADLKRQTKNIIDILNENNTPIINLSWGEKLDYLSTKNIIEIPLFFEDFKKDNSIHGKFVRNILKTDLIKERKALKLKESVNPYLFILSLDGLKKIVIHFYQYSKPEFFGNVSHEDVIKYGKIIEKYYLFYDQIIGKYLSSLRDNELLIIFSPHGLEPLPLWKRILNCMLNVKNVSAHYENAPEGVILFYGSDVAKGENIEDMRIIDIVPTILYYYGFPIGKDMDGTVIKSIFKEEFRSENPVIFISSYDEISIK